MFSAFTLILINKIVQNQLAPRFLLFEQKLLIKLKNIFWLKKNI